MSLSLDEIQDKKRYYDLCKKCIESGLHVFLSNLAPEIDSVAAESICKHYREAGISFLKPNKPSWFKYIASKAVTIFWISVKETEWVVALNRRSPRLFRFVKRSLGLNPGQFFIQSEQKRSSVNSKT